MGREVDQFSPSRTCRMLFAAAGLRLQLLQNPVELLLQGLDVLSQLTRSIPRRSGDVAKSAGVVYELTA